MGRDGPSRWPNRDLVQKCRSFDCERLSIRVDYSCLFALSRVASVLGSEGVGARCVSFFAAVHSALPTIVCTYDWFTAFRAISKLDIVSIMRTIAE
jgi:hypothetical protein